jgi:GNAT superfamily N-acetyltransferase
MPDRAQDRPEVRSYEDINFTSARHVSLLAVLSQSNDFYYHNRKRFLNIENERPLVSQTGSAHGILAFAGAKAVAFIIYHKFDDTNPRHQTLTHSAIEIQFHLVDKKRRGRGIGTLLLHTVESQYAKRIISVEVDETRGSAPYYTKMGYNLNFVTNPCFGTKVTYGRKVSFDGAPAPSHPDIKYYYKLILSDEITRRIRNASEKLSALINHLPQEDRRDFAELLKIGSFSGDRPSGHT